MKNATASLADVKPGDRLILENPSIHVDGERSRRIATVYKVTGKTVFINGGQCSRDTGKLRASRCYIRLPILGEIAELDAAENNRREQFAADQARRQTPEYRIASAILSMSDQQLVDALGRERILQIGEWICKAAAMVPPAKPCKWKTGD